jgi:Tfp pilus assembly pilus retraction ATPase PilT
MTFDKLILEASARGASDIHLRADHVPLVRIDGLLERWTHVAPISAAALEAVATRVLSPLHQQRLQTKMEVDIAWRQPPTRRR